VYYLYNHNVVQAQNKLQLFETGWRIRSSRL